MISFTPTPICLSPQRGLSLCPSFFSGGVTDFTHGIEPIEFNRHSPFAICSLGAYDQTHTHGFKVSHQAISVDDRDYDQLVLYSRFRCALTGG
jgi:hypothetical protein